MAIHPFQYIASVAARYGRDEVQVVQEAELIVGALGPDELRELAQAYEEIARREDSLPMSEWIRAGVAGEMEKERHEALMLLILFHCLAEQGTKPFTSRAVQYHSEIKRPVWDHLPPGLRYLAAPAGRYGIYQSAKTMDAFRDRMTATDHDHLRTISARIASDRIRIEKFLDEYDMCTHKEAELVYFLIGLLDSMGLRVD